MMTTDKEKNRQQIQFFSMDELVPEDHLLRLIDRAIDWSFIYDLVKDKYSEDQGRPSIDPVVLIKIPLIQYLYNIKSMRQTMPILIPMYAKRVKTESRDASCVAGLHGAM